MQVTKCRQELKTGTVEFDWDTLQKLFFAKKCECVEEQPCLV